MMLPLLLLSTPRNLSKWTTILRISLLRTRRRNKKSLALGHWISDDQPKQSPTQNTNSADAKKMKEICVLAKRNQDQGAAGKVGGSRLSSPRNKQRSQSQEIDRRNAFMAGMAFAHVTSPGTPVEEDETPYVETSQSGNEMGIHAETEDTLHI
ncbi:hypothetical protein K469DRAFT_802504 [Zopfia rhizophila CBS 207.26]|uniref:Uncharacterized protein n=1 Tax=Zopfia rhizophila CBS 207.26 TaxID=1314779 RepID=A0A6A6DGR6_9PEZI|nr:hypothetical protein K469DRAFT_802504 [Zopfia rhizophila CBS 207.26]